MINKKFYILTLSFFIISCSTIESTIDSTIDSISEAGDYIYDSVNFWEDETDEPQQSEAIIIEEAVEVPDYALPDDNFVNQEMSLLNPPMQQMSQPVYKWCMGGVSPFSALSALIPTLTLTVGLFLTFEP